MSPYQGESQPAPLRNGALPYLGEQPAEPSVRAEGILGFLRRILGLESPPEVKYRQPPEEPQTSKRIGVAADKNPPSAKRLRTKKPSASSATE